MRFYTHAFRAAFGLPLFATWSPDEKHSLVMLRLSRTRRNDPVQIATAEEHAFAGMSIPDLGRYWQEKVTFVIYLHDLEQPVPPGLQAGGGQCVNSTAP